MTGDLEEELPVASGVSELVFRWAAQRDTTENEGSGVVGQLLVAALSRLVDYYRLMDSSCLGHGEHQRRVERTQGKRGREREWIGRIGSALHCTELCCTVRKLCQKCMKLTGKGSTFERKQTPGVDVKSWKI